MRKKILICDDDEDILELCKDILKKEYEVVTINRIDDIVQLMEDHNPDLVIMDLWIPQNGGDEATIILKKNKSTRRVPVILFSANDEIENICEKIKADGFIRKPFSVKTLKKYVREKTALESN